MPKTISVNQRTKKLSNEDGFKGLLDRQQVLSLVDHQGVDIEDFESLDDGGTYTLGPPVHSAAARALATTPVSLRL